MKVYTRTGDKGTTALIGGKRVPKNHLRIETYGTVDELISFLGLLRDHIQGRPEHEKIVRIQDELMTCSAILATDGDDYRVKIPKLSEASIVWLEHEMDNMDEKLPQLTSFILPGGHPAVSYCHVARTICRRAERLVLTLSENHILPDEVLRYLNRLSDYLFVLSRWLSSEFQAVEILWKPMLD